MGKEVGRSPLRGSGHEASPSAALSGASSQGRVPNAAILSARSALRDSVFARAEDVQHSQLTGKGVEAREHIKSLSGKRG